MNSLEELNGHGIDNAAYNDQREPIVIFSPPTPSSQTLNAYQGSSHQVPVGLNIVDIINYAATAVSYIIDLRSIPGAYVEWYNIPAGCVVSNPSTGIYKITGINSVTTWNSVKNPTIFTPYDLSEDYSYNATISYLTSQTKTWDINIHVLQYDVFNNPTDFDYVDSIYFQPVSGMPTLYDYAAGYETRIWNVYINPVQSDRVQALHSSGVGGTSTYNSVSGILTIIGTKGQINSHLSYLFMRTVNGLESEFNLQYRAVCLTDGRDVQVTQNVFNKNLKYLMKVTDTTYNEDTPFLLTGAPSINDSQGISGGIYTYTITPSSLAAIRGATFTGTGGTIVYNPTTHAVEITGTKAQINDRITKITLIPSADYTNNIGLNYKVITPVLIEATKTQTVAIGSTHSEISNIISRVYDNDIESIDIFSSNSPQITDLDPLAVNYTIELSTPIGMFGTALGNAVSNYTYTGTKAQVNSILPTIKFFPTAGVYSTDIVTFHLLKDNSMLVNSSFTLSGPWTPVYPKSTTLNSTEEMLAGASNAVPFQIDIIGPSTGGNSTLDIDLRNCIGATLTVSNLLNDVTVTTYGTVLTGFQYTISGINSVAEWNAIKSSIVVNVPLEYYGTFSYTVILNRSIQSGFTSSYTWGKTLTVYSRPFTTPSGLYYNEDTPFALTGYPTISANYTVSGTYTVTITPSNTSAIRAVTFGGTGGTVAFDTNTKVITISGTKAQVNARLANITLVPGKDYILDFTLAYYIVTPFPHTDSQTQYLYIGTVHDEMNNIITRVYDNDLASVAIFATNAPQITDLDTLVTSYTIQLSSPIGKFGTTIANAVTNYSYTGTKAQINALMSTILFIPNAGVYSDSSVSMLLLKDGASFFDGSFLLNGPWTPTFPKATGAATTETVTEGGTRTVPFQIDIIGPVTGSNATLNIDLRNCPGATLTNGVLAGDVVRYTYGNATAGYQYGFENITTVAEWNSIKASCLVNLPNAYSGSFSYTVTLLRSIQTGFTSSYTWTDTLTVTDVYPLSTVTSSFSYYSGTSYNISSAGIVPTLADSGNTNPTWTVVITPQFKEAISSWTFGGSGGSASFNATTMVATISGTVAQVNSRLSNLTMNTSLGIDLDFTLTYVATNNLNSETGTRTVSLNGTNTTWLAVTRASESFSTGVATDISNGPLITDLTYGKLISVYNSPEQWTASRGLASDVVIENTGATPNSNSLWLTNGVAGGYGALASGSSNSTNLGSGDFTIEFFIMQPNNINTSQGLIVKRNFGGAETGTWGVILNRVTSTTFNVAFWDLQNVVGITTTAFSMNGWIHVAIVRASNTVKIYIDGNSLASGTMTTNFTTTQQYVIGDWDSSGGNNFLGRIDDIVISNVARYTANFYPNFGFTPIPDANTLVCFPFNEPVGSTQMYDTSKSVNVVYNQSKGNVGSISFNGGYLTAGTSTDWRWYDSDYTIETWVYNTANTGTTGTSTDMSVMVGMFNPNNTTNYWSFGTNINGKLTMYWYSTTTNLLISTNTVALNAWSHIAMTFTKSTNTMKLWINGVLDTTYTVTGTPTFDNSIPLTMGKYNNITNKCFIDEFRISKIVRYTNNFIPVNVLTLDDFASTALLLRPRGFSIFDATEAMGPNYTYDIYPYVNSNVTSLSYPQIYDGYSQVIRDYSLAVNNLSVPSDPESERQFVSSRNGNVIVYAANHNNGEVRAFFKDTTGMFVASSTLTNPSSSNNFGYLIAISDNGSTLAVSAPNETISGLTGAGCVYIFTLSGTTYSYAGTSARLTAQTPTADGSYGGYTRSMLMDSTGTIIHVRSANNSADMWVKSGSVWTRSNFSYTGSVPSAVSAGSPDKVLSSDGNYLYLTYPAYTYVPDYGDAAKQVFVMVRNGSTYNYHSTLTASKNIKNIVPSSDNTSMLALTTNYVYSDASSQTENFNIQKYSLSGTTWSLVSTSSTYTYTATDWTNQVGSYYFKIKANPTLTTACLYTSFGLRDGDEGKIRVYQFDANSNIYHEQIIFIANTNDVWATKYPYISIGNDNTLYAAFISNPYASNNYKFEIRLLAPYTQFDSSVMTAWDGTKLRLTNSKSIVNALVDNIKMTSNATSDFYLMYKVTNGQLNIATRNQKIIKQ